MKRALILSWAAALCTGCGLFHGAHSDDGAAGRASDGAGDGTSSVAGNGANAGAAPAAPGGNTDSGGKGPGTGPDLEQVWIGELWTQKQWFFCDPEDPQWRQLGEDPDGFTRRVLLRLDLHDPEDVGGEIRFGDTVPRIPERPDIDLTTGNPSSDPFWFCSFQLPTEGFDYRITSGRSSSDGVDFDFAPNQIWEHWCATEKPMCRADSDTSCRPAREPTCVCEEGECHADLRARRRIRLSHTADTLEGNIVGEAAGTPIDIRLRRVK